MEQARTERLKAYGFLALFAVLAVIYGVLSAPTIRQATPSPPAAAPLLVGAVVVSLATVAPMVLAFRPATVDNLVAGMREKARRSGKPVNMQSASRTVSLYVAALASTPILYGVALLFLVGELQLLLLLLPAAAILAAVGWFVLGRFFRELNSRFVR